MRKDDAGKTDWCKHSRNSRLGRRGHNKRVRLASKALIKKELKE